MQSVQLHSPESGSTTSITNKLESLAFCFIVISKNGLRFTVGLDRLHIIQFRKNKVIGELERPEFF